jgi:uncharacterized OB-fold protein
MITDERSSGVVNTPTRGRSMPATSHDSRFFWDGAREGKLLVQRCSACGALRHPPGPACMYCHSLDSDVVELSGRGVLYSYTVQYHPLPAGFDEPPIVGVIELEEGIRFVSNVVGVERESLKIGEPLEVYFVDQAEGWTAPVFRRPSNGRH